MLPGGFLDRVEDLVGAVAIMNAEMHTLQRQHAALEFLMSAAEERIQGKFATDEEHAKLYTQLLQLATTVDEETKRIWEACNKRKGDTAADESSLDGLLSGKATSPSFSPSGSAAVNFARLEHCRANCLDERVTSLLAQQQQLQAALKDVQPCGAFPMIPSSHYALWLCTSSFRSDKSIYSSIRKCLLGANLAI